MPLQHPATRALDDKGCRDWDQGIEDEAEWLAGILLIPEDSTLSDCSPRLVEGGRSRSLPSQPGHGAASD